MANQLLTTAEVANRLGVTKQTVVNYVNAGRLNPAQKLPGPTGAYLFDLTVVEELEAAR